MYVPFLSMDIYLILFPYRHTQVHLPTSAMPALEACGRNWEFGSDDLFFPVLSSVIIRSVWFMGLMGGALYFKDPLLCEHMHYVAGFALALIVLTFIGIVIEGVVTFFSARGSIVHVKPRRFVVQLLYLRIMVLTLEVVLLVIGTALVFVSQQEGEELDCPHLDNAITAMQVIVGFYWFSFIVFVIVVVTYLDPCHCYSAKVNYSQVTRRIQEGTIDEEVAELQWQLVHSVWEKRFRVFCCVAGSDDVHHLAYKEVAEIFAHLFCDTNVVMSDIAAGLILLQKEHLALEESERRNRHCNRNLTSNAEEDPSFSFDFHHPEDRDLFRDAVHFLKYALGMYSWPIYVYMNPFCGLCRLYNHLNCCGRGRGETAHVMLEDDRCSCHLGGLRQFTGLNEMDIISISFENDVYKVPYIVCLDHETKSVVVAFRGTFSFGDIVTDLTASTKPMELPGYPNFLVHKGMHKTVTAIIKKMDEDSVLESAFSKVPGYKLVVVGHSLGSGCACIFSILLRERYPDLRCFCYSPTGALLNEAAAEFTEDFVTSVTLGNDLVARLNVPNTHKLKDDLVRVIESSKKPKCRILLEGCLETLCTCFGGSFVFDSSDTRRRRRRRGGRGASTTTHEDNMTDASNDELDGSESKRLLVAISIDPEQSLTTQPISGRHSVASDGDGMYTSDTAPILRPQLSSLKLPVRSTHHSHGRNASSVSPTSSLTQEVERRLVSLYPPGRIVHIVDRSKTKTCFCDQRQLEVQWASRHDFNQISVSPDMVRDHFPDVLCRAMNKIWTKKLADLEDSEVNGHHHR